MLQSDRPDDYIIATGKSHSVRDFLDVAFSYVGLDYKKHVVIDPRFIRPVDVNILRGDSSKAQRELGWEYNISFEELVHEMVEADLELFKNKQGIL